MRNKKFVKAACAVATVAVTGASTITMLHAADKATISYDMTYLTVKLNGRTLPSGSSVSVGDTVVVQAAGSIGTLASEQTYGIYANGTNIYTKGMESARYTITSDDTNIEFTVDSTLTREDGISGPSEPSTPSVSGKLLSFNSDDLSVTNNGNPLISGSMVPVGATLTYEAGWRSSDTVKSVTIAGTVNQGATGTYTVTEDSPSTITFTVDYENTSEEPETPQTEGKYLSFNSDDISITNNGSPLIDGSMVPVGATLSYEAGWRSSDPVKSVTIAGTVHSGATGTYTVTEDSPEYITFSVEYKTSDTPDIPDEQKYQISYDESTANVSVNGQNVRSGEEIVKSSQITVTPITKTGYKVKDVKIVGVSTGKTDAFTFTINDAMTSPITIEVVYEANQSQNEEPAKATATLVFDPTDITVTNENGSLVNGSTVSGGERLSISVADKSGYELTDVKVNGTSYGALKTMSIDVPSDLTGISQINIVATYTAKSTPGTEDEPAKNTAILIYDSSNITVLGSSGTLANGSTVSEGDKLTISIADKDGYDLTDTKVNGVSYGTARSMIINVPDDLSSISQIKIEASYTKKGTASNENPTDDPNTPSESQTYVVIFPDDVSVMKYEETMRSGGSVKEGDVLRITAFKENNNLTYLKVNGTSIENGSLYTVDGTSNINITTAYTPIAANTQSNNSQQGNTTSTTDTTSSAGQNTTSATATYPVTVNVSDSSTRKSISNVHIAFYNSNRALLSTYTTDAYGSIYTNLAAGTYYYRIVNAPDGYIIPEYDYYLNIYSNGSVSGETNITLDSGAVTITRKDPLSGVGVGGSTITIKDSNGNVVTTATTDSSGKITVKGLKAGTYTYTETSAPSGYSLDTSTYSFTIRNDGSASGTLTSDAVTAAINLYVKDSSTDKGLSGITVTIYDSNNNAVKTGTTDSSGRIIINDLGAGTYTFKVTGGIPSGYEDLSETGAFTWSNSTISGNSVVHLKAKSSSSINADGELADEAADSVRATVIPVNSSSAAITTTAASTTPGTPIKATASPISTSVKVAGSSVKTGVSETSGSIGKAAAAISAIGAAISTFVFKKKKR